MNTIGKVNEIEIERNFEWKIEDFASLSSVLFVDDPYNSPPFSFAGESWYLKIYPNGQKKKSVGFIDLHLHRKSSGPPITLDYSLVLKTTNENADLEWQDIHVFEKAEVGHGSFNGLKRSEFLEKIQGLSDVLTVICTMKCVEPSDDTSSAKTSKCEHCKKTYIAKFFSLHEEKCSDMPIKCPQCYDVTKLKDWYNHKCQKATAKAFGKLSHDLEGMMLNGENKDTRVKVKGEEFQLHRDILAARNPYFRSMFTSNMKEKSTGFVTIDDCEPDIFRIFVHFIYSGKVDNVTPENVCDLYETTDMYQEDQLKKICFDFMMKTISEDSFYDYIALALKYDEKKLFEKCVDFLISKPKEIVRSVKWQNFAREYPTHATELIIKTLDYHVK